MVTYINSLSKWTADSIRYIKQVDRGNIRGLYCFGTGCNGWGVQTNQKAIAAFAAVAMEEGNPGILDYALGMLRYSMYTHIEGCVPLSDGERWGHTWISALGIERMMHVVPYLLDKLPEEDRDLFRKIMISESDWLTDHYEIHADLGHKPYENRPESNIWNGAIILRTCMMYPDVERKEEYLDKAKTYFVNGISIAADKDIYPEHYIGANFYDSYALDHHEYMNVGYMIICLSNIAMLHFAYRQYGQEAPGFIHKHALDLWKVVKSFIFPDGRLCRIGGDSRVRYCYCQDYIIPTLLYIKDVFRDSDCESFEMNWMEQFIREQDINPDNLYLSIRCRNLSEVSPLYYTRLEGDRACVASMAHVWAGYIEEGDYNDIAVQDKWKEDFHGAWMQRNDKRIASFVFRGAEGPTGLNIPIGSSDMAEWRQNMVGEILDYGKDNRKFENRAYRVKEAGGGFIAVGETVHLSGGYIAEGKTDKPIAEQQIVFAGLPDGATTVCMQYARTINEPYIKSIKGMFLQIPNDMFNGYERTIYTADGELRLSALPDEDGIIDTKADWLNIDNKLGLIKNYGESNIEICRHKSRQIGIRGKYLDENMLYADEYCLDAKLENRYYYNEVIIDVGFSVKAGVSKEDTRKNSGTEIEFDSASDMVRCTRTMGENGKEYFLIANFGGEKAVVNIKGIAGEFPVNGKDAVLVER